MERPRKPVPEGFLLEAGQPLRVLWFCEKRPATRDDVEESMNASLDHMLIKIASGPEPTEDARRLKNDWDRAKRLLPIA